MKILKRCIKGTVIAGAVGGYLIYQKSVGVQEYIHQMIAQAGEWVSHVSGIEQNKLVYIGIGCLCLVILLKVVNSKRKKYKRLSIPPSVRMRVFERDKFHCTYCGVKGKKGVELHVDHIIPVSRGGSNKIENLQTLCRECNIGKAARIIKR